MTSPRLSRRAALAYGGQLMLVSTLAARAAEAAVCTPDFAGDKKQRASLHYVEASADPKKTCANCMYYQAQGSCGHCRILECPVNPDGTCDSWSLKTE